MSAMNSTNGTVPVVPIDPATIAAIQAIFKVELDYRVNQRGTFEDHYLTNARSH
ncbi:hypothetical protein QCA50_016077 [Cerrena zonata]|uniref:Uncharacterized protein n=1 Tax=Cerrena zonata TaxID=2478898 RepID=A0AAW0FRB3_9APHY